MAIDLNRYIFPEDQNGNCAPLPKQQQFMDLAGDPNGPKVIGYFGGVGSGKSVTLCGTILGQCVQYGGEWVISRLYMPELRRTTMKTFLEMIPPELLVEHRIADAEVKIKSISGKPATVYFVGLDEPTKLLSLNLSGAGIDEGSEVPEEAFLLLLNRLRNKNGLRKLLVVGNPRGHNWVYKYLVAKKNLKNPEAYHMIHAPSTENKHLPDGYVQGMLDTYSPERIKRDVMGSFESFEGQVYTEYDRSLHVVRPFVIPNNWSRHIRIDHGFKNPASVGFYAISPDGDVYKYREIYVREWLISEIVNGNQKLKKEGKEWRGISQFVGTNVSSYQTVKIDPSTKQRNGIKGESAYDEYVRNWNKDLPDAMPPIQLAKNDVVVGIDRVKQYLKPHPKSGKPSLFFFDTCVETLEEIGTYRYPELRPSEQGNKSEKENPVKIHDHAMDEMRYMVVDLPERYKPLQDEIDRHKKYTAAEIRMQDEYQKLLQPKEGKDPFGDGI